MKLKIGFLIKLIMVMAYIGMGIFFLTVNKDKFLIPESGMRAFGLLITGYGIFRSVRLFFETKNRDKDDID